MSVMFRKHRGVFGFTGIAKLAVVGFLVAIAASFVSTIWAVYLEDILGSPYLVGYFSASMTIISFIAFFVIIPFIEKSNKARMYYYSLFGIAIVYFGFAFLTKIYFFVFLALAIVILTAIRISVWGIMIKDKSQKKDVSRNEGLMYTFFNIAFLVGPLAAGLFAQRYGNHFVFLVAGVFVFIAFLVFGFFKVRDANIQKKVDGSLVKNFKNFFKDKDRAVAYFLGGGVNLWWVFVYLFIPLYIVLNGYDVLWIGYFFAAVVIPLILFEYYFSKLAGRVGFKKIFVLGFLIVALVSLVCFFISSNIILTLGILVLGSFGMAMVEPTTEAYFLDILKKKDECRFYAPYNTSIDVTQFLGEVSAATVLVFLPFKFVFLLFAVFMFGLFLLSFKTKKVIENRIYGKV
ncbi:MAG: MFS transporter [Nanoarchaeota archaeon]|nr:MFS transporter [Nanoarchaeota archaeon]